MKWIMMAREGEASVNSTIEIFPIHSALIHMNAL